MIKALFYEQEYLTDILQSSTYKSQEIFVPKPYDIIIIMGGDRFHKLNQLNVIQKNTNPNRSTITILYAKNVRPIDFPISLAKKCAKYVEMHQNQEELMKFLNDNILIFLSMYGKARDVQTIKVTIYEQNFMLDTATYFEGDTRMIFINSPYNILIIMGSNDFHDLSQISVIQKVDLSKYKKYGNKTNTTFNAKNIRETFMPIDLVCAFAEFVSNNQEELKYSLSIDVPNFIMEQKEKKICTTIDETNGNYCDFILLSSKKEKKVCITIDETKEKIHTTIDETNGNYCDFTLLFPKKEKKIYITIDETNGNYY